MYMVQETANQKINITRTKFIKVHEHTHSLIQSSIPCYSDNQPKAHLNLNCAKQVNALLIIIFTSREEFEKKRLN